MYPKNYFFITSIALAGVITLPSCGRKKQPKKEVAQVAPQQPAPKKEKTVKEKTVVDQHPASNKKIENLTHDEALKVYAYYKKLGKKIQIGQTIQRILALSTDHDLIDSLLIELADLEFEFGHYPKAEEFYAQHAQLYPGGERLDYVMKQTIESSFKQMLEPHRDQTKTKDTIRVATKFLSTFPAENQYTERINFILQTCYMNLMEHELNQVLFYLNRYNLGQQQKALEAAWQRLMYLNREIVPHITNPKIKKAGQVIEEARNQETPKKDSASIEKLIDPLQKAIAQKYYDETPAYKRNFLNRF